MKLRTIVTLITLSAALAWRVGAQTYDTNNEVVETFAGSGFSGYTNGIGQQTMFASPSQIVTDSLSNLFVWDGGNYLIRKITPGDAVSTFTGAGAQTLHLPSPLGMAIDRNNTIWLSPSYTGSLYNVATNGFVTQIPLPINYSGSQAICVDSLGNIYFTDQTHIYRYNTNGIFSVFAGSGNLGSANGNGIFTSFNTPTALANDAADNIYVWDSGNCLIRRIDQGQNVVTFAGKYQNPSTGSTNLDGISTNAGFASIYQMCFDDSGNLLLACGTSIRKISASTNVTTIAGSFTQNGYTNGAGNLARFSGASGVCFSQGMIFIADSTNERIRNITFNPQPQVVSGANLGIGTYAGLTITGVVGRTYQIQTSLDGNAWNTVATVLLNSSPYFWIDQNRVIGNKFYRAVLLP